MIILQKGQVNDIAMNINNNSRVDFSAYTMTFVHIMSQEEKSYIIDTSDPSIYGENDRYCEIVLDLATDDLNYEGQYQLTIYGNGTTLVFTGIAELEGTAEEPFFTQYVSDDEDNSNYIYIQE
jgi:hypothetical protein